MLQKLASTLKEWVRSSLYLCMKDWEPMWPDGYKFYKHTCLASFDCTRVTLGVNYIPECFSYNLQVLGGKRNTDTNTNTIFYDVFEMKYKHSSCVSNTLINTFALLNISKFNAFLNIS